MKREQRRPDTSVPNTETQSERRIRKAMRHADKFHAGARNRRRYLRTPAEVREAVKREFERDTLWSGSGHKVTTRPQANAIANSEARRFADRDYLRSMTTEEIKRALRRPHKYVR